MNFNNNIPAVQPGFPAIAPAPIIARRSRLLSALSMLLSCALLPTVVEAEGEDIWPFQLNAPTDSQPEHNPDTLQAGKKTPVDIDADTLDLDQGNRTVTAQGNVRIVQTGLLELRADQAQYQADTKQIEASGHIRMARRGDLFSSERVIFNLEKQQGSLEKVDVNLRGPGGRATAAHVDFKREAAESGPDDKPRTDTERDFFFLKDASFTNCECDPPPWHLTSKEVEIDRAKNRITAKNVRLYAGNVPVFAFPWWRQPLLPKRESGLLPPSFRVGGNGFEMELPYYWNIAANRDATVALRSISRRGLMTNAQYRYLDQNYKGRLEANGLYDTVEEAYRGIALLDHEQKLEQWKLRAHLEGSRTRNFINDFEQKLVDPHSRRMESAVTVDRFWARDQGYSSIQSGVRWYQDLEQPNDDNTVQNLPFAIVSDHRLLRSNPLSGKELDPTLGRWRLSSEARMDNFYQLAKDSAQRFDLAPVLHFEKPVHVGNVSTTVGVRETAYLLNGDPNQTGQDRDSTLHRESALVALRLNSTLSKQYGSSYLHTLEPSVQYVMNAASDQSKLPNYDASLRNFTITDLFAHNLYSGIDRISDAQWVGYGLTSRLLNHADGNAIWESGVLTIGQRWAPSNSRTYQNDKAFSALASNLEVKLSDRFSATAMMGYDPYQENVEYSDLIFSIKLPDKGQRESKQGTKTGWIQLGHHFNDPDSQGNPARVTLPGLLTNPKENSRERVEDLSLGASVRLSDNWIWNQKTDYSLESSGLKSWGTGLVYEHDCWSLNLTGGRNLATSTNQQGGTFIGLFINLQGLGGVGI
ncbi:MAG: LPS-assembly protein LptD [Magnetococcales bacterium]|nr:LPS-assembly protein LptD [Magnetococcales bacterium]